MNLTISTAPIGAINVRASEEYSSEGVYETYAEEQSVQTYAEENVTPEQVASETETVHYDTSAVLETEVTPEGATSVIDNITNIENEAVAPISEEVNPTEVSSQTENVEVPTSEYMTESVPATEESASTTEIASTVESTENQESTESSSLEAESTSASVEDESNREELSSEEEEESSSEEDQTQEIETGEENKAAVEVAEYTVTGTLHLNQFLHYEEDQNGVKKITIQSDKELILLSNCDQQELQNVEIYFNTAGSPDITEKNKIEKDTDLSAYLKNLNTATVASDSKEQAENNSVENSTQGEQSSTESNDAQATNEQDDSLNEGTVQTGNVTAGEEYTFKGIGSADYPFCGKITGQRLSWKLDRPFFEGLSSNAVFFESEDKLKLLWSGDGTKPMIATVYQLDPITLVDDNSPENSLSHDLSVYVSLASDNTTMGCLIGTVRASAGCEKDILNIGDVSSYTGATVNVLSSSLNKNSGLICNVLESGNIHISNEYEFPSTYTVKSTTAYEADPSAAGNAGGVIGVMKKETMLSIGRSIDVSGITVDASGNAGGFVGFLGEGAKIVTEENATVTLSAKSIKAIKSAGGLVGLMQKGSQIVTGVNASITLSSPSIEGDAAGGIVGTAEDVVFANDDMASVITVAMPTITGNTSGASAGGFAGRYVLNAANLGETAANLQLSNQIVINQPKLTVNQSSTGVVGGYFGLLSFKGKVSYTIGNADENPKKVINPTYESCNAEASGAIVGQVISDTITSTLMIQNMSVHVNNTSSTGILYHGGLVGKVGAASNSASAVYLEVSNIDIEVVNPVANESGVNGFGGIAGLLAQGSILKIKNSVTVATPDSNEGEFGTPINQGGGLVGYAEKSVIDISGTTDLSKVGYQKDKGKSAQIGWLVGKQESALIYAEGDGNGHGWSYIRGKEKGATKQAVNDIGNYGQVIRLQPQSQSDEVESQLSWNLIRIDDDHKVTYLKTLELKDKDTVTLSSADDFALLSIVWNTRGYFSADNNITGEIYSNNALKSKNITLSANIDLTGSGIAGLTRDSKADDDIYTGTMEGSGNTLTLSIGESFGFKQENPTELAGEGDDGYGEVIAASVMVDNKTTEYHSRQGLFAVVSAPAKVQNLTINGKIYISNAGTNILAGGIAGETGNSITLGVTVNETITADCEVNSVVAVGGFFGGNYGGDCQFGILGTESTLDIGNAIIKIENCKDDSTEETKIYAGELIGEVNNWSWKLQAHNVKITGEIITDAKSYAYIGGLIGSIKGGSANFQDSNGIHWIEIESVIFDGFKIEANNVSKICGGLFGSIWANVGLYFMKENGNDGTSIKLDVIDAEINAPNAENVGGLAYRSSGSWEIRNYGINLQKLTIKAGKNVGLLVCKGTQGKEKVSGVENTSFGALYLSTTKYWGTSYEIGDVTITTTENGGVFDEFVAYTAPTAEEITVNGQNGVISIATAEKGNKRVGVDKSGCTTYQNRTAYGRQHQTNACSRYYYDLDQCLTDATGEKKDNNNNGMLDTPEELLLWSVYNYANENIRALFTRPELKQTVPVSDITIAKSKHDDSTYPWDIWYIGNEALNMEGYSYYPINFTGGGVTIYNTTIHFYNNEIEEAEKNGSNKSTQGNAADHTQHYTMHCGLFLSYTAGNSTLDVSGVTFAGSIGKVGDKSGVLVANVAEGTGTDSDPHIITINIRNVTFDGLRVKDCGDTYAPLLINSIEKYLTLNVNTIKTKIEGKDTYEQGTAVASSLIGFVGSSTATQINLSFQKIILPDKRADGTNGIFSHATLLESFAYKDGDSTSSAMYNFYKEEDWNDTTHIHEVTYGREITETVEFPELQRKYYNEETYYSENGLVYDDTNNKTNFSAENYLPYVCVRYDPEKSFHEIKVNQRVTDIIHGCGTYGHPYQITTEKELEILSEYMSTGNPRKDWKVTVTVDQSKYHVSETNEDKTSNDVTYQWNGYAWVQVKNEKTQDNKDNWQNVKDSEGNDITITAKEFMRQYLLNAYYDLKGSGDSKQFNLTDFKGFGTSANPFRGVLMSSNEEGTQINLNGTQTCNGFIPYSYGSVVRNLTISYQQIGKTLEYNTATSSYSPEICFGGVIGCILGGDNIIENVTVNMAENSLYRAGAKSHLIPIGAYVGAISGGGVIFRNMTDRNGLQNNWVNGVTNVRDESGNTNLYVNPYIGRVLDGFAFYEKTSSTSGVLASLSNTNKNYEINSLNTSDTQSVTVTGNSVNVNDAQGLLILSAIVNSGAASNGLSNAYRNQENTTYSTYKFAGVYGKVRTANYDQMGSDGKPTDGEIAFAKSNDTEVPGTDNLPYLIQKYCSASDGAFGISRNSNIEINLLSDNNYHMAVYGNGYQGIGARYLSNAARSRNDGGTNNNSESVIPEIKKFNGNNRIVFLNMQVKEYADDDFHAASMGGIFNILRISSGGTVLDLTIAQKPNTNGGEEGTNEESTEAESTEAESADATSTEAEGADAISADTASTEAESEDITSTGEESTNADTTDTTDTNAGSTAEVSLRYYTSTGGSAETTSNWTNRDSFGLGGFAGSLVGYTSAASNRDITISNVQVNGLRIISPASAGGIFGNTGKPISSPIKYNTTDSVYLIQPQEKQMAYGIAFNNCSYSGLEVNGKYAAGGFAGYIGNQDQNPRSSVNGNGFSGSLTNTITGQNSNIRLDNASVLSDTSYAGGLFGYIGTRIFINMTDAGAKNSTEVILRNVNVEAANVNVEAANVKKEGAIGGCIGYINTKCYGIHNVTVEGTETVMLQISKMEEATGTFYAGGIVGYAKGEKQGWPSNWTVAGGFTSCTVRNVQINVEDRATEYDYTSSGGKLQSNYIAGGIVGCVEGGETTLDTCTVRFSKVYGSVAGGIVGQTNSQLTFTGCIVEGSSESKMKLHGFSTASGILGFLASKVAITILNSKVQNLDIEGKDWGVGTLIGDADSTGAGILYLFNSSAQNCNVTANSDGGGRWPCVGGIIGNLRNDIKASNILFSGITLASTGKIGLLFGSVVSNDSAVNIAGISIQNIPDANKSLPLTGGGSVTTGNDYIAFADYSGTALTKVNGSTTQQEESKKTFITDGAAPYVTTSPDSTFSVYVNKSTTDTTKIDKYLYGDGISWDENGVEAKKIWENKDKKEAGHYAYKNITTSTGENSVSDFEFGSLISTYNENQTVKVGEDLDFPVVRLSNGDADVVKDYLNILTNGAFSAANGMNKADDIHVTAIVDVYTYNEDLKKFEKPTDASLTVPAFKANTDPATGKITFSTTTDYDNDKNRFTLLTVTFTEKGLGGTEYQYNVFVPVLVRRMLEMDFIATLTYGTDFNKTDYTDLSNHVLESFGSSITGYLTYVYNSDAGIYTDYGWQSYINAGGNLMYMKKSIRFVMATTSLPVGTQLTLVDEVSKKAYYYEATGDEKYDGEGISIPLSSFMDSSKEISYQEPSISELIGAVAEEEGENLIFIKVNEDGSPVEANPEEQNTEYPKPTIRIKTVSGYEYYRLADPKLGEIGKYAITVEESNLKEEKEVDKDKKIDISTVRENYYLVITVPANSKSKELNGSIQTTIETTIPKEVNYQRRKEEDEDKHVDTASTYQLSNGYQQTLEEVTSGGFGLSKKITTADSIVKMNVTDQITFPNSQSYQEGIDQLYLRFVGGLQKTVTNADGTSSTSVEQFPSGTTGMAKFSVYIEENGIKKYYKYNIDDGSWSPITDSSDTVAVSYTWTSDGGSMELPVATKQQKEQETTNFISLQGIRNIAKKQFGGASNSTFYVELNLEATIPAAGLNVIPETQVKDGETPSEFTKLTCFTQLSTIPQSLTYSSNRASLNKMNTAYYRDIPAGATLTYDADIVDQLGINLLDLQYLDAAREKSTINTTATYDLSSMKNLENTLKDSSGIRFTLTLSRKEEGTDATYGSPLSDADQYLEVNVTSENSGDLKCENGTWTWTVPQTSFYANGIIEDGAVFKGGKLTQLIELKVNVKDTSIYYSNYKVVLTAEILDSNGKRVTGTDLSDNIIYTFAKIKPEFVAQ